MLRDSFFKNKGEMLNGAPGYIPIFGILTLLNCQLLGPANLNSLIIQGTALLTLAYPFMTA
jgi:hypothetical protein